MAIDYRARIEKLIERRAANQARAVAIDQADRTAIADLADEAIAANRLGAVEFSQMISPGAASPNAGTNFRIRNRSKRTDSPGID